MEKHHIDMNPNIEEIDFDQLTTELALTLNADNGKLYNLMGFDWIDIDRNGDILMFNTSFMIFRKNEPIHFQTRYKDNGQLEIRKSWGLEMSKGEAFSRIFEREPETFMELPLRFLGKIPWDHLKENLNLSDYDKIGISNDGTGDGQGNIWVEADALKTFLIDEKGNIIRFEEKTVVPSRDYQVINFSPAVYLNEHSSSGRMEVQYFFKTK